MKSIIISAIIIAAAIAGTAAASDAEEGENPMHTYWIGR